LARRKHRINEDVPFPRWNRAMAEQLTNLVGVTDPLERVDFLEALQNVQSNFYEKVLAQQIDRSAEENLERRRLRQLRKLADKADELARYLLDITDGGLAAVEGCLDDDLSAEGLSAILSALAAELRWQTRLRKCSRASPHGAPRARHPLTASSARLSRETARLADAATQAVRGRHLSERRPDQIAAERT
jgi:hypothetical protein